MLYIKEFVIMVLLALVIAGNVTDIMYDYREGASLAHLFVELCGDRAARTGNSRPNWPPSNRSRRPVHPRWKQRATAWPKSCKASSRSGT